MLGKWWDLGQQNFNEWRGKRKPHHFQSGVVRLLDGPFHWHQTYRQFVHDLFFRVFLFHRRVVSEPRLGGDAVKLAHFFRLDVLLRRQAA